MNKWFKRRLKYNLQNPLSISTGLSIKYINKKIKDKYKKIWLFVGIDYKI